MTELFHPFKRFVSNRDQRHSAINSNQNTRWSCCELHEPGRITHSETITESLEQKAGWAPRHVWTFGEEKISSSCGEIQPQFLCRRVNTLATIQTILPQSQVANKAYASHYFLKSKYNVL